MNIFDRIVTRSQNYPAMELDLLAGGDPLQNPVNAGQSSLDERIDQIDSQTQQRPSQNEDPDGVQQQDDDGDPSDEDIMDGMPDQDGGDDDETGEDPDEGIDGEDPNDQQMDPNMQQNVDMNDAERRKNLRKLIVALHSAYSRSLTSMYTISPPANAELSARFYSLKDKMQKAKDILFTMATTDIVSKPYEDTLRRYTAMDTLYNICLETIDTLVPKDEKIAKAIKRAVS